MDPRLQRRVQRYGWDLATDWYDDCWADQLKPAQTRLLEFAALEPGERVLDVACGTGLVSFPAARAVGETGELVGTDISASMVDRARRRAADLGLAHASFERMDAESLSFPDRSFDAGICALGLMYVPDPLIALQELRRVMKPGGRAAVAVWGRRDRCGWAEIFPIVDSRVTTDVCPLFFQLGTGDSLAATMREAGFADVESERIETLLDYPTEEEALAASFSGGPVALAYSRFDERTREEAHEEYLASIADYGNGEGYRIPGEFVVARGVRR